MKSKFVRNVFGNSASLSARRVWIEIISAADEIKKYKSLSARRVWIEIAGIHQSCTLYFRHSLRGECGLKYGETEQVATTGAVTLCEESVD